MRTRATLRSFSEHRFRLDSPPDGRFGGGHTVDALDAWSDWMRAQGLSTRTINERLATARMLLRVSAVDGQHLSSDHIIAFMAREMKPASRATYHATIRAFCTWMQRTGIRADNPTDGTPRPRRPKSRPRPLEESQVFALLEAANRRRTKTYILLAVLAGLRVHEIAKIRGDDIDPYTKVLTVVGKGGKVAALPLHPALVEEACHYPREAWWFPSYTKEGAVGPHAVSSAIRATMLRAGFDANPHQLRHSYGTELVRQGIHLRIVQELMRHESPASTAIYTEINTDQLRAGIASLRLPRAA